MTSEILLALWKIHILHHAAERPIYGQWISAELRHHGYDISPGTLYPLLRRMARVGWLEPVGGNWQGKARQEYRLTARGSEALATIRDKVRELHEELAEGAGGIPADGCRQTEATTRC